MIHHVSRRRRRRGFADGEIPTAPAADTPQHLRLDAAFVVLVAEERPTPSLVSQPSHSRDELERFADTPPSADVHVDHPRWRTWPNEQVCGVRLDSEAFA
ncbi:hypothetical protein JTB14_036090 [Gonioctena quinquepunctata]|nr:hypothetical protein JTB14_036090 [Gonioctena quinquepunctata]